ncbi:SnoaL-like polyketide cyclase [Colletotrichum truncatum]|uniref:SnoaL-like polyketide cyclase n=1 Tax=Colletotrichum truncatum TaxID=5467 RepID=A0ACC3YUE7_COLTU|nr:SnoaL-like polyketide cyclase [Colletotrichum truncatum]KAF6798695.1 SnoaL-like polyketide cyclase [Colletotrichum truncatum]
MTTVTMQESEAPCFAHEAMLAPPPANITQNKSLSPIRKSHSPGRRWNGDGKGIQVDIGARLREYIDCLNNCKWDVIGNHLADNILRNGHTQTREDHISRLRSRTEGLAGFKIKIDTMLVDKKAQAVAARYINRMTLVEAMVYVDPVGKSFEFDEQCYVWFDEKGKISRIVTLQDNDGIRAQNPTAATTPKFLTRKMPDEPVDLQALYRAYVASINNRTTGSEFPKLCRKEVRHNNRPFSVENYGRIMEQSHEAISGLHFEIQELLVDEDTQQVAARLEITGTPISEFAGVRPNGKSVKFHEHCMYRFDKGKIAVVWATMELDSFRRQLEAKADRRKSSMLGIN